MTDQEICTSYFINAIYYYFLGDPPLADYHLIMSINILSKIKKSYAKYS